MAGRNVYDISPEEREIKEWRAARRLELRNEYLRELHDPYRHTAMADEQMLRYSSTRNFIERLYTPSLRNLIPAFVVLGLMWGSAEFFNRRRDTREHLYRTGQVSYRDRMYKFTV